MNQRDQRETIDTSRTDTDNPTRDTVERNDDGGVDRNVATAQTGTTERGTVRAAGRKAVTASDDDTGFLPDERMEDLRDRWDDVQTGFVDNPRAAVQEAHDLVENVVDELTGTFTKERDSLEGQWNTGNVDTEALRVALQRYRSFFDRLLAT